MQVIKCIQLHSGKMIGLIEVKDAVPILNKVQKYITYALAVFLYFLGFSTGVLKEK